MRKKINAIIISIVILVFVSTMFILKGNLNKGKYTEESNGLYVLGLSGTKAYYYSKNFKLLSEIDLWKAWELEPVSNNKVYATIIGTDYKSGREIAVLKNGRLIKKIPLEYSLPLFAEYNPNDGKAYVAHVCKITKHKENCITVIDTQHDKEINNILFDREVDAITFWGEKMYVSSLDVKDDSPPRIDIFNVEDYSIEKTFSIDLQMITDIKAVSNDVLYAVNDLSENPEIYVIDCKKGLIMDTIKLPNNNPYKVFLYKTGEKTKVYVSHYNIDDSGGETISVIDPYKNQVIKNIEGINCPASITFFDNKMVVGDEEKEEDAKLFVYDLAKEKVINIIPLETSPDSIAKAGE